MEITIENLSPILQVIYSKIKDELMDMIDAVVEEILLSAVERGASRKNMMVIVSEIQSLDKSWVRASFSYKVDHRVPTEKRGGMHDKRIVDFVILKRNGGYILTRLDYCYNDLYDSSKIKMVVNTITKLFEYYNSEK